MPILNEILKYKSVAIVGMAKNTGKTVCLNYVLSRLRDSTKIIGVTSIGIDGENNDNVFNTHKPEIVFYEGMFIVTSELHYRDRRLGAEVYDLSNQKTSLGRLVYSKVVNQGKALISGPATTKGLLKSMDNLYRLGAEICIVDGALSRKSIASPAITNAMVLATGAAVSANINQLVYQTKYTYDLIKIEQLHSNNVEELKETEEGIWKIDRNNDISYLGIKSCLSINQSHYKSICEAESIFINGALTDKFLKFLINQKGIIEKQIIVRDFTKIFAKAETFYNYLKLGGNIKVLDKTNLIAITVNPTSPSGYVLNSTELISALKEKIDLPIYDIKKL
ncbi:MAG: hypothetical protein N4A49_01535 [Marinifilaceae bacterium]|jgi:hypothetical protein|nr:hypothetical protein [Marinifilaceae bacterium]